VLRLGVTGTDTGVGKTVVAAAVLALLRKRGLRVAAMKPVETGVVRGSPDSDAFRLGRAAGARVAAEDICPVVLPDALAPMAAATRAGAEIDLAVIDLAFERLSSGRDAVVVESDGGLLAPISRRTAFDDLFRHWRLDALIVAANRLGAINHTMLTVEAARSAGLRVRAVVLNAMHGGEPSLAEATNEATLRALLDDVPIVSFPWLSEPRDATVLADVVDSCGLSALLDVTD
jgi:dethiobiotin synthetase